MSNHLLCGRVIKGKKKEDFEKLTDEAGRKIVMLIDAQGIETLSHLSGEKILLYLGWRKEYLRQKVREGNIFKLVVFQGDDNMKIGHWDNVIEMVRKFYPEIIFPTEIVDGLKSKSFSEIEKEADYRFIDVKSARDSRFMTAERLLRSKKTLVDYRAFLYHQVHLKELFSGDGWTRDLRGKKILREYLYPNRLISQLDNALTVDIKI